MGAPRRRRRLLAKLLLALAPIVLLAAALELFGWWRLPPPPLPGTPEYRSQVFHETFYEPDPDLVVRLRPDLVTSFGVLNPDRDVPVRTNALGFRGAAFPPRDDAAFRILVLGDSVTFGLHLAWEDCWPVLMEGRLRELAPDRQVQVRNLAVPGYSTMQGRILFERHALGGDFAPHLVLFAFGFNDGCVREVDDLARQASHRARQGGVLGLLLRAFAATHFGRWLQHRRSQQAPTTCRVAPADLEANLEAVAVAAAARGIGLMLADSCLPHTYPRAIMARVAERHRLPLVAFRDAFCAAKGIADAGTWVEPASVRVALHTRGVPVPPSPDDRPAVYVLLVPDATFRMQHRRVALHDDGTDGDAVAADGVWSCAISLAAGTRPEFAFGVPGLSPALPAVQYEATLLDGVHWTTLSPQAGTVDVQVPEFNVPPWPELVLVPDAIHASPAGSRVIAEAMAAAVMRTEAWRR